MSPSEFVSLETLAEGAAIERFNLELERVLENIADPNTKPTAARKVVLEVKFTPDEDREVAKIEILTTSKIAPMIPFPTQIVMGKHKGKAVASEWNPRQRTIPDAIAEQKNILKLPEKEA